MAKLWQKGYNLNKQIEDFTVGDDFLLDEVLVKYDCIASKAHAAMLCKIGILSKKELESLKKGLDEIMKLDAENKFVIKKEDEDCHTAIENYLTENCGEAGKKIHTARSRNDQVLTATRLYSKDELEKTKALVLKLIKTLEKVAAANKDALMPGYTHMQKAMPSSVHLWLSSFSEALKDDLKLLETAFELNDQSPLGSCAGYGTNISVDKEMTAKLLGFKKVQENSLYVQNSRGKIEAANVFALSNVMNDLAKLAGDILLFSTSEFGFMSLSAELCTGSSVMPQKKNLDVMELVRAKASSVSAKQIEIGMMIAKLPSGYNRDLQLTKKPLMESFEITQSCLKMMDLCISNLIINKENMKAACTQEIYAADEANKLVMKGMAFREAYKKIGAKLSEQD
jgi:argininosuccinate lyase